MVRKIDDSGYMVFMTYFDCCKIPLLLQGVELIDSGAVNKSYCDLANDYFDSVLRQYAHYTPEKAWPIRGYGEFFNKVCEDPARFIQPQPELREHLQTLIKRGKKLFLATNSHYEYAEVIMTATFGKDW